MTTRERSEYTSDKDSIDGCDCNMCGNSLALRKSLPYSTCSVAKLFVYIIGNSY